jgi:hypothetical protein
MSGMSTPLSPEQVEIVRAWLSDEDTESKPDRILRELLNAPEGLVAKDLAEKLHGNESTIRRHIANLKVKIQHKSFGNVTTSPSSAFRIRIAKNPYRVMFKTDEQIEAGHRELVSPKVAFAPTNVETSASNLLSDLLDETFPDSNEQHDFRLVTSAFTLRVKDASELKLFLKPLERGVKVSIILLNPRNLPLCHARFALRTDLANERTKESPTDRAVRELYDQIEWLSDAATHYPNLRVRLTNTLPLGFVALNANRASLGFFMAKTSAADTPHVLVEKGSPLFEALKVDWNHRWEHSMQLEEFNNYYEFWGAGPTSDSQIIIQGDRIEKLAADCGLNEEVALDTIKNSPPTRAYKARTWVNRWDIDAAVQIRDKFQEEGIPPPELLVISRKREESSKRNRHVAFVVSLGLGFTLETTSTVENRCDEWMRVVRTREWGDALLLNEQLVSSSFGAQRLAKLSLTSTDDPEYPDFKVIIPIGWTLTNWLYTENCPDYAIILRYTIAPDGAHPQTTLVAAGFTDRATSVSGQYLAKYWKALHTKAKKQDFLAVISGPSNPAELDKWSTVEDSWLITPTQVTGLNLRWRKH